MILSQDVQKVMLRRDAFFILVAEHNYTVTPDIRKCYSDVISLRLMDKINAMSFSDRVKYIRDINLSRGTK